MNNTNAIADVCLQIFFRPILQIVFMSVIDCLCARVCVCVCLYVCVCGWLYRTSISSNWPLKVPESAFAPTMMAPAATHCKEGRTITKTGVENKREIR